MFGPHRRTIRRWPVVRNRVAWSVCRSVCRSVIVVSPAKTAAPIEMPFGLRTRVDPRKHVLDGMHLANTIDWTVRVRRDVALCQITLTTCYGRPALQMRTLYFCPLISIFFHHLLFFSSPNLSGRRLDVYHTSTLGFSANLECMSEMCCTRLAGNTGRKKSPFWHHGTTLSASVFAAKACIDNWKKILLNIDSSSTCPHNMVNLAY